MAAPREGAIRGSFLTSAARPRMSTVVAVLLRQVDGNARNSGGECAHAVLRFVALGVPSGQPAPVPRLRLAASARRRPAVHSSRSRPASSMLRNRRRPRGIIDGVKRLARAHNARMRCASIGSRESVQSARRASSESRKRCTGTLLSLQIEFLLQDGGVRLIDRTEGAALHAIERRRGRHRHRDALDHDGLHLQILELNRRAEV